ncbi:hypothetical protein Pint_20019 [Pistacia integerrima]|uniref:Uncharacterized protein n=1 Tax=Pistacia integerrima TaxID=434235 RepID=A0ACC0XEK1_9ROSI|nr:hypothetical protein Pint_20019 [Pistacia integerrima]
MKMGFSRFMGRIRRESLSMVSGGGDSVSRMKVQGASVNVKVKEKKDRAKVPIHIPTIKRPQEKYNILVNNLNHPFQHVWLQRYRGCLILPTSLEETPFKLVEEVKDLKELAAELRGVNEFAVKSDC